MRLGGFGGSLVAAALLGLSACKGSTVDPRAPGGVTLSDDAITFTWLGESQQVTATVRDQNGSPLVGAQVSWSSDAPGVAEVSLDGVITARGNGTAAITATSGPVSATVDVEVEQVPVSFAISPDPLVLRPLRSETLSVTMLDQGGSAVTSVAPVWGSTNEAIATVSGDGDVTAGAFEGATTITGVVVLQGGGSLLDEITVEVDLSAPPVALERSYLKGGYPGQSYSDQIEPAESGTGVYEYSVTQGALPPGLSLNAATGAITGTTQQPGVSFFELTVESGGFEASAVYAITVSTNGPGAFNLWAASATDVLPDAALSDALDDVLASWERVVTSDIDDTVLPFLGADACDGNGAMVDGMEVDDVVVLVELRFDAPGDNLGFGGSCIVDESSLPQTIVGFISLDMADLDLMEDDGRFAVLWHELGHVMGIGGQWEGLGLSDPDAVPPVYTGTQANLEYDDIGGNAPQIVIEDDDGPGTAFVHWEESHFGGEIMTGYADLPAPISRVTIGALADLGWSVVYGEADDEYQLLCAGPSCVDTGAPARAPGAGPFETAPPFEPVALPGGR